MENMELLHLTFDKSLREKIGERLTQLNPTTIEELIKFANSIMGRFCEIHPNDLPDTNSICTYFENINEFVDLGGVFNYEHFCNMVEEYYNERLDGFWE